MSGAFNFKVATSYGTKVKNLDIDVKKNGNIKH